MLLIAQSVIDLLLSEAAAAHPLESCGLLFGSENSVSKAESARNVAADPCRRFEIDPADLIAAHKAERTGGPTVLGYFHSHPDGMAEPSAVDRAHAVGDGKVWAIIAGGEVSFWRDGSAGFEALSYVSVSG